MKKILLILTLGLSCPFVAKSEIDLNKFIQECQIMKQEDTRITMVWWMPYDYWKVTLEKDPRITERQIEEIVSALKALTIFAVVDAEIGPFGGIDARSREEIAANSTFVANGESVELLEMESLNRDAQNLFRMMKPVMAQMIGQVGEGMEFLVFENENKDGQILDAKKEGSFTLTCYGREFSWRLPLGSLLPPKFDSETGESFPGNYHFNPFSGRELVTGK